MAYSVRLMPRAELDVDRIYSWIAERSQKGAQRWWLALVEIQDRLQLNPLEQAIAPEFSNPENEVRQILFKTPRGLNYRALYVVVNHEVLILRVRGPGQPELADDELK